MCECIEGSVIVCHDREDGPAAQLVDTIREGFHSEVEYVAAMDDVISSARPHKPHGRFAFHLLETEPGQEIWAAGRLQARYQAEFVRAFEHGMMGPGGTAYSIFQDPDRSMVAAPNAAVYLAHAPSQGFHFDTAVHSAYKSTLNIARAAQTGRRIRIAVVDSGLDVALQGWADSSSRSFHDDTTSTNINDVNGHGTAVASIIHDVAPDADLTVLKIGDKDRSSEWNLAAALQYLTGPDIINLSVAFSLGAQDCQICGRQQSHSSRSAIFERVLADLFLTTPEVLVVAAAGNGGLPLVDFPARFANVIAVGAVNSSRQVTAYSNTGAIDQSGSPHSRLYFAPGGESGEFVGTTVDPGGHVGIVKNHYGTSFAAPYVSGMIALYLESASGTNPTASSVLAHFQNNVDTTFSGYNTANHGNGLIRF